MGDELFLYHNHHKDAHTWEILSMIAMTIICIPSLYILVALDFSGQPRKICIS